MCIWSNSMLVARAWTPWPGQILRVARTIVSMKYGRSSGPCLIVCSVWSRVHRGVVWCGAAWCGVAWCGVCPGTEVDVDLGPNLEMLIAIGAQPCTTNVWSVHPRTTARTSKYITAIATSTHNTPTPQPHNQPQTPSRPTDDRDRRGRSAWDNTCASPSRPHASNAVVPVCQAPVCQAPVCQWALWVCGRYAVT